MPTVNHPWCPHCGQRYERLTWISLDPLGAELSCVCGHIWQTETVGLPLDEQSHEEWDRLIGPEQWEE